MNKKISLVTLGLSLSSIVILTGAMVISQPKYTLKNIVGKQSSLGDVVVYSQEKRGIYSTNNMILSKDKYQFNKNVKQNPDLYKYSKEFNKNRDLFQGYVYDTDFIYSDKNSMGYIEYIDQHYGESDITLSTTIKDKNLDTGEISKFRIDIPNSLKPENNNSHKAIVTKYDGEVYIILLGEQESNSDIKKTGKYELEYFVEISKVDFNNKEAKSVNKINLKVDDKSKYRLVYNNPFVIDNRVYFYLENQDTLENNYYLAYYDMENNKFDYIDNKINLELPLESYQQNVEGEKLNLLSDTENKSKVDLSLYTIDLTTGKIVINNEQYSIKKLNKNMCLNTLRIIDNKIYILSKTSNADNMNSRLDGEYTDNVIVLDKNSKSTLYIGEYMQGEAYRSESYILKNNEL
nr:hypothetical protein [uncultured Romboutsia sp.]